MVVTAAGAAIAWPPQLSTPVRFIYVKIPILGGFPRYWCEPPSSLPIPSRYLSFLPLTPL